MYRIRFHGRGGQGMKTGGRILGRALFLAGFEVQDAPRYGAERRGAPIFAYVRADRQPISERGIITVPDLVLVADDSLPAMPASGVLAGAGDHTVFFLVSREPADLWQERLNVTDRLFTLPPPDSENPVPLGALCAGAGARLLGLIPGELLSQAIARELAALGPDKIAASQQTALAAFEKLADLAGLVQPGIPVPASTYGVPAWIDLAPEGVALSAPAIHGGTTSEIAQTGLWRTERPIIHRERCNRCWWICSTFCPEGAIQVDKERRPAIDYDHCKGCMICLAQCPAHAIEAQPEREENRGGKP